MTSGATAPSSVTVAFRVTLVAGATKDCTPATTMVGATLGEAGPPDRSTDTPVDASGSSSSPRSLIGS